LVSRTCPQHHYQRSGLDLEKPFRLSQAAIAWSVVISLRKEHIE